MTEPCDRDRRVVTRLVDGNICAYDLTADARGVLSPAMVCRPPAEDDIVDHAAPSDLRRAFYGKSLDTSRVDVSSMPG